MSEIQVLAVKRKREGEQFEILAVDGSIIIKCILNNQNDRAWSGFSLELRQVAGCCVCDNET